MSNIEISKINIDETQLLIKDAQNRQDLNSLSTEVQSISTDLNSLSTEVQSNYLRLSGGTLTNNLYIKDDRIIINTTSDEQVWGHQLAFIDKDDKSLASLQVVSRTTGLNQFNIKAVRKIDDTSIENFLRLNIDQDGTRSISLSDSKIWRQALGLGNENGEFPLTIQQGGTNANNIITARKNLGYLGMFFADTVHSEECIYISKSTDLNSASLYTATGKYVASNTSLARSLSNCPTDQAFQMLVYNLLGTSNGPLSECTGYHYRTRILMEYTGKIYTQNYYRTDKGNYVIQKWKLLDQTEVSYNNPTA